MSFMRLTGRRLVLLLSVVVVTTAGVGYAWDQLAARTVHRTGPASPRAAQGKQSPGFGPMAAPDPLLEQLAARLGRQAQLVPPPAAGRYVGTVYAALTGEPPRIAIDLQTTIDARKLRQPGTRALEVAPDARIRLYAKHGNVERMTFDEFAERFNGSSKHSVRTRGRRYWIDVGGDRVTAMGEYGPRYQDPLSPGDEGKEVQALQRRLAELHYDVGEIDGRFGYDTEHAVVAFKKVNRMHRDHVVDRTLWTALYDPVVPRLERKGKGRRIEIDLTRQVLYLVDRRTILRIVDVSTGGGLQTYADGSQHIASTPTGDFHIFQYIPGWYESSVGPMYESNFFATHIAIHGSGSVPTYPASHGCVRVTVPAMDRLLPELEIGMAVSVYRG